MQDESSRSSVPKDDVQESLGSMKPAVTGVPVLTLSSSSVESKPSRHVDYGARGRLFIGLSAIVVGIGVPVLYYATEYGPKRSAYIAKVDKINKQLDEFDSGRPTADVLVGLAEQSSKTGDMDKSKLFTKMASSLGDQREAFKKSLAADIKTEDRNELRGQNLFLRNIFWPALIVILVGVVMVSVAIAKPQRLRTAAIMGIVWGTVIGVIGAICSTRVWEYYPSYAPEYPSSIFSSPVPVLSIALPVGMVLGALLGLFLVPSDPR